MKPFKHGTRNSYNRGCRCDLCTQANTDYHAELRLRLAQRRVPDDVHGTKGGYHNWACRCDACTLAAYPDSALPKPEKDYHGTTNGYNRKGCRCLLCTDAKRAYRRELYKRKRDDA